MSDSIVDGEPASPVGSVSNSQDSTSEFILVRRRSVIVKAFAMALLLAVIAVSWGYAWRTYRQAPTLGGPPQAPGGIVRGFNGFDVSDASVPQDKILRGGPPRDGIPAILDPKFLSVAEVTYLKDTDEVLGFIQDGDARAYPLRILVHHEIANDTVGDVPIAVTYCPLCGTCMVFDRRMDGETFTFGVSGLLYQSDVLMYDHQSESLWSQLKMESVAGDHVGTAMRWLDSKQMTWAAWKAAYPDSRVLSPDTGFARNYGRDAYSSYKRSNRLMFPVPETRTELKRKAWVGGVIVKGISKAYPIEALAESPTPFSDTIGGEEIEVVYDAEAKTVTITASDGVAIPTVQVYWFAWQAFYPDTLLHTP